jgi:hypothetical protein
MNAIGGVGAAGLSTLNFSFEILPGARPAAAVNANGARLMTVRGDGWRAATAARDAAQGLQAAMFAGATPADVAVEQVRGSRRAGIRAGFAVKVGARRIVLVDGALAAAAKSSREALAAQWAKHIRAALAAPHLILPVDSQIVPAGERRILVLKGSWRQAQVTADEQVIRVQCDSAVRTLSLTAVAVGKTQVILDTGAGRVALPVQVMKYAGRVAASAEAIVTGRRVPADVIKQAASAAVYYSIEAEHGASAEIRGIIASPPSITPGGVSTVTMQVSVEGPGYLPVRAAPQVRVVNSPLEPMQAQVLMVSNRPERLPSCGMWYEGRVPLGCPARLLYHHVNAMHADAELAVELVNASEQPVRVQVVHASGGPSNDEVFAGHKAARDFLQRQADDVGFVVAIPGRSVYTASADLVKPGQVVSGLSEVRVLGEGDLRVVVRLRPPTPDLVMPAGAQREPISSWIFTEPNKRIEAKYRVGNEWAFATIGDRQVLSSTGRELLDGDYGVFYDITFDIENPTPGPARLELAFMPGGGLARGIVMIDGQLYETRLLRYGETQRLFVITVPAGGQRQLCVRTMPQAGSNYPVKLVLRPKGVWD